MMIDHIVRRVGFSLPHFTVAAGLILWFHDRLRPLTVFVAISIVCYGILAFLHPPKGTRIGPKALGLAVGVIALLSTIAGLVSIYFQ